MLLCFKSQKPSNFKNKHKVFYSSLMFARKYFILCNYLILLFHTNRKSLKLLVQIKRIHN